MSGCLCNRARWIPGRFAIVSGRMAQAGRPRAGRQGTTHAGLEGRFVNQHGLRRFRRNQAPIGFEAGASIGPYATAPGDRPASGYRALRGRKRSCFSAMKTIVSFSFVRTLRRQCDVVGMTFRPRSCNDRMERYKKARPLMAFSRTCNRRPQVRLPSAERRRGDSKKPNSDRRLPSPSSSRPRSFAHHCLPWIDRINQKAWSCCSVGSAQQYHGSDSRGIARPQVPSRLGVARPAAS